MMTRCRIRQQISFVQILFSLWWYVNLFCRAGHYPCVQNLLLSIRRRNPPCNAEENLCAGLVVIEAWFSGATEGVLD